MDLSFERAAPVEAAQFSFEWDEDRDFDGQPDDWARRTGSGFPQYIGIEIDRQVAFDGQHSLRIDVEGGQAAYYSAPAIISPHHSYVFSGRVRTFGLKHDAAMVSLSFLDARRDRVQRVLSVPVSGSSDDWVEVNLGPVMPRAGVRYVVVGCHLVHDDEYDYRGNVWFDALSLRMLPRLTMTTNFDELFGSGGRNLEVDTEISGLDLEGEYELTLLLEDASYVEKDRNIFRLNDLEASANEADGSAPKSIRWTLRPPEAGFYRLHAVLRREGETILEKATSIAFLERPGEQLSMSEKTNFGWSIENWPEQADPEHLLAAAEAAGIGWIKLPLWNTVHEGDVGGARSAKVAELIHELKRRGIRTVGVLGDPPRSMRRKFADDWNGVAEVFTMPPDFWMPSLEPVMARYSSLVHHWQLGSETDRSFIDYPQLPTLLDELKRHFDRLGRDTQLGAHWSWDRSLPARSGADRPFLSLSSIPPLEAQELQEILNRSKTSGFDRWALLRPQPRGLDLSQTERKRELDQRITELMKRIVAAKIGSANVVFAADVFHQRLGLLNDDASPSELFLPWRTWASALDGAEYLGSLRLPKQSTNHVFLKGDEAVICVWAEQSTTEQIALGKDLYLVDVWGRTRELEVKDRLKQIPVSPLPILLRGASAQLAKFRLDCRLEKGVMPSSTAEFQEFLTITNPFDQGLTGECEIRAPREWEVRPREVRFSLKRGETARFPIIIRLPGHQSLGPAPMHFEFKVDGESVDYVKVTRDIVIGLGDVTIDVESKLLPSGSVEIRQKTANNTEETLTMNVSLYIPGQKRQRRRIANLQGGETNTITYRVPGADQLAGRTFRIRAEQIGGNRVLNKSWTYE